MKIFHDKYVKLKQNKIVVDGEKKEKRKRKEGKQTTICDKCTIFMCCTCRINHDITSSSPQID